MKSLEQTPEFPVIAAMPKVKAESGPKVLLKLRLMELKAVGFTHRQIGAAISEHIGARTVEVWVNQSLPHDWCCDLVLERLKNLQKSC